MICDALGGNPYSFQKKDGFYDAELHHIIPVSNQVVGSLSFLNIITLCANHHRQIHYGNVEILSDTDSNLIINLDGQEISIHKIPV